MANQPTSPEVDPLLPLIAMGRPMVFNNQHRAKIIREAAARARSDPTGFEAWVQQHIEWAQAEAVWRASREERRQIEEKERPPDPGGQVGNVERSPQ